MIVDFFDTTCKEKTLRTEKRFGICDDQNGTMAYTDIENENKWIAKVTNENEHEVSFTVIDNCMPLLKEGTNDQESTCDGMLTFGQSLYLVELKNQGTGGWISESKKQLENTLKLITANHDLTKFRYKKAYACNKKHPNFTVIDSSESKSFFRRTGGFRLDIQTEIVIK